MSRAPNASAAYISTESRLPAFRRIFDSPALLARLVDRNQDLSNQAALSLAVAKLVGGDCCVPASKLKHNQLVELLY